GVEQCSQSRWQGEGHKVVSTGQEPLSLLLQPTLGLLAMALGTMAVAAGVITILLVTTVLEITLPKMAPTGRGAAAHQILQHLLLAGQKTMRPWIGRPVEAENVGHLDHGRPLRVRASTG